jgi:hypothetical protein
MFVHISPEVASLMEEAREFHLENPCSNADCDCRDKNEEEGDN